LHPNLSNNWLEHHTFVTRDCPASATCEEVAGTRDKNDVEYWRFWLYEVDQIKIGYGLIPVSPRHKSTLPQGEGPKGVAVRG